LTQWGYGDPNGGETRIGTTGETPATSPYTWYREEVLGNPNVQWEKVQKSNLGVDYSFFNNLIAGSFDYFEDKRTDILISGDDRAIPSYFGAKAPVANLGKVQVKGFELELRLNKKVGANARIYGNINITHSKSEVLERDDPQLLPDYQKQVGYVLGQTSSHVSNGYYNTWDALYASTPHGENDGQKLPGNYNIIDFNGDGIINTNDNIPYGFSGNPQNTYSSTIGFEWSGFAAFVQFYGVNNVTRQVVFNSLERGNTLVYDEGSYWSQDQVDADVPMPRWKSTPSSYNAGNRYMFDGSYLRLKNAEVSYTFNSRWEFLRNSKIETMRLYVNGNNLFVWTDMPDDRESNFAGTGWASQGAYPTVKRYNIGLNITF
ncbi:MAG: SusC/RagA family TonB-linked outer membrane protein, partial [Bacteroidales bacterium]|nr:SusC/RagA family TonB-linked outer membrane protein [Bacteroidales bacterium]